MGQHDQFDETAVLEYLEPMLKEQIKMAAGADLPMIRQWLEMTLFEVQDAMELRGIGTRPTRLALKEADLVPFRYRGEES